MSEFFQRPVVRNTSPVISLCKAGLGHLLVELFPKVLTTTAVAAELRAKDFGDAEGIETVLSTIEILPAPLLDPMLATILDPGEASILQLVKEHGISGVLMDERRGRRVAMDVFGFEVAGPLKSVEALAPVHGKQLLTYLRLLRLPLGLLINFGAPTFREGCKRVVHNHQDSASRFRVREKGLTQSRKAREEEK